MHQILQDLRTGETLLADVPAPRVGKGQVRIRTARSLISLGTERMLVSFGRAGWIDKARSQPEKVRQVLDKVRTDGLLPTVDAVMKKLGTPLPLGYCSAGTVIEVGPGVRTLRVGDRVASNGPHAEVVVVPEHLCARIPDGVSFDDAVFTVVASIALQGIRLAEPTLGERVVVTGLGLVGLLTVQLLRANGCRVLGLDYDSAKVRLARQFGAEAVDLSAGHDALAAAEGFSGGRGVDAVLVTASTDSSDPINQGAAMCRPRGRVIQVGLTGLELDRKPFYDREIRLGVSCSYGPGRYDARYEQEGLDWPIGWVRWTEQRNFEAVLDLLSDGALDVAPLRTHTYPFERALEAYAGISEDRTTIGAILEYAEGGAPEDDTEVAIDAPRRLVDRVRSAWSAPPAPGRVALIGAGPFAVGTLIPSLRKAGAEIAVVASRGGRSGAIAARTYGIERTTTDTDAVLSDPDIDAVVIATGHRSHASLVAAAIAAGKRTFVEKPLAIDAAQLGAIETAWASADNPFLMVGFNRRFAPTIAPVRGWLAERTQPAALVMMVNAGVIPADHPLQDPEDGGGRIIGEGCHWIDLVRCLVGHPITRVSAVAMGPGRVATPEDKVSISLGFADGSIGTIHYFGNGTKQFPKERLEVFCQGGVAQVDNFRSLKWFGVPGGSSIRATRQDKGHAAECVAFMDAVRSGAPSPIPFDELVEVTRASFEADRQARES